MRKFFLFSVDSVFDAYSVINATVGIKYKVEFNSENVNLVDVNDHLLGFVSQGVNQFRFAFRVIAKDGNVLELEKEIERLEGVCASDFYHLIPDSFSALFSGNEIVLVDQTIAARIYDGLFSQRTNALMSNKKTLQKIIYGAPGTGKSHQTNAVVKSDPEAVRTTFHPDSDYSTFVGAYKPTMKSEQRVNCIDDKAKLVKDEAGHPAMHDVISYSFVPQAFTKAYVRAWKKWVNDQKPQYLVIEEINRGNCAQIFGDIFQLLDRENGFSTYPIEADTDLARYIAHEFRDLDVEAEFTEEIKNGIKLKLPPNLYIWATMNTSDQSLFPMDSAFKRRWDWKYVPISDAGKGWFIKAGKISLDWWAFLTKINERIYKTTDSEDKQLGYFFVKLPEGCSEIPASVFVNKVLFYLYSDVFKDYGLPEDVFSIEDESGAKHRVAFADFFMSNGDVNEDTVAQFLKLHGGVEIQLPSGDVDSETVN